MKTPTFIQSYPELKEIAVLHARDTNFCGIVSIAAAARTDYMTAKELAEDADLTFDPVPVTLAHKGRIYDMHPMPAGPRIHGQGTPIARILQCIGALRPSAGFHGLSDHPFRYGRTVATALRKLPKVGTFIVWTTSHVATVRDGEIIDWLGENRRHRIRQIIEVRGI